MRGDLNRRLHGPVKQHLESDQRQYILEATACKDKMAEAKTEFGLVERVQRGPRSSCSRDSSIELPEGELDYDLALKGLVSFEWQDCTSRDNVRPPGQLSIKAMCLGIVKPFFSPWVTCSRRTRMLPNVTRLATKLGERIPDEHFRYGSVQLNQNYSATLHVDKNNHGPSWIIGLGDYEGGQLWVMDDEGDVPVKITARLMGYKHLKVGQTIMGKLHDIKNKWFYFLGQVPHTAMPFTGVWRISLVYFTRKGSLKIGEEIAAEIRGYGFKLPDEAWLTRTAPSGSTVGPRGVVTKACRMSDVQQQEDAADSSEDEVDEDENMHRADDDEEGAGPCLRAADWAQRFRELLGVAWDQVPASFGVCVCSAGLGAAPALALQELLPLGNHKVISLAEDDEAALRFCRQTVKLESAYKNLADFEKGKGFCEVRHSDDMPMPASEEEHLFYGSFLAMPLLNRSGKRTYANDPKARPLKALRAHLSARRPPLALLEVPDWDSIPLSQQRGVLDFLLKGPDEWNLRIPGFSMEIMQVDMEKFGVPCSGRRLHILLAHERYAGPEDLKRAADIACFLGSKLPRSSVQELLDSNDDPHVQEVRQKCRAAAAPTVANVNVPGAYTELMRTSDGETWFNSAEPKVRVGLNRVYKRAADAGLDIENLLFNMVSKDEWRDDGLLPAAGSGYHYSFLRHRPLTGREELMCRGYAVSRLNLRGLSDNDLRTLAAKAPGLQATAASLSGLLAVADLSGIVSGGESRPASAASRAWARLRCSSELPFLGAESTIERVKLMAEEEAKPPDDIANRAVVLLSLLSHGSFGTSLGEEAPRAPKKGGVVDAFQKVVALVPADEEPVVSEVAFIGSVDTDEPRSWHMRARKLRCWDAQNPPLRFQWALKWVSEAAADSQASDAADIIDAGAKYMMQCMEKHNSPRKFRKNDAQIDGSLHGLSEHLDCLLDAFQPGVESNALAGVMDFALAILLHKRDRRVMLGGAISSTKVIRHLCKLRGQMAFLTHLKDALGAEELLEEDGLWKSVSELLQRMASAWDLECIEARPDHSTELGLSVDSHTKDALAALCQCPAASQSPGLLLALLKPPSPDLHLQVEVEMARLVGKELRCIAGGAPFCYTATEELRQMWETKSDLKGLRPGHAGRRFASTVKILNEMDEIKIQLGELSGGEKTETLVGIKARLKMAQKDRDTSAQEDWERQTFRFFPCFFRGSKSFGFSEGCSTWLGQAFSCAGKWQLGFQGATVRRRMGVAEAIEIWMELTRIENLIIASVWLSARQCNFCGVGFTWHSYTKSVSQTGAEASQPLEDKMKAAAIRERQEADDLKASQDKVTGWLLNPLERKCANMLCKVGESCAVWASPAVSGDPVSVAIRVTPLSFELYDRCLPTEAVKDSVQQAAVQTQSLLEKSEVGGARGVLVSEIPSMILSKTTACVGFVSPCRMQHPTDMGFQDLQQSTRQLIAVASQLPPGVSSAVDVDSILKEAQEAASHYCESPVRLASARTCLRSLGLSPPVVKLLEDGQLLERLAELGTAGPTLLHGLGLPPGAHNVLLKAAKDGRFSEDQLVAVVPRGWSRKLSNSTQLWYLFNSITNEPTFVWPLVQDESEALGWQQLDPPMPVGLLGLDLAGQVGNEEAPYIVNKAGQVFCSLCTAKMDRDHAPQRMHQEKRRVWTTLQGTLRDFQESTEAAGGIADVGVSREALLEAWRSDLLSKLQEGSQGNREEERLVLGVFWHSVVQQSWPQLRGAPDVIGELRNALREMVSAAGAPEPLFVDRLPEPGKDFPCFPAPGRRSLELHVDSLEETIDSFSPEELLGEGLVMQENGKVICKFCCDLVEVPCLRMHLHPHYKEAKRHRSLQQTWAEPIEWLKTSGWQLESQRIRCENGEFRCKCNPKPMNLYDLRGEAGHLQSKKHKDFLASLPAPEPGAEAMQREAWALKMPSACEEHIRCLVRQQTSRAKAVAARAPKAAPPVPRPMPPVAGPAAGTSTGSREAPDQAPMQEPPLPVMGKDFPRLVKGSSNVAQK
ncbi:unnamed protein product, partial [Polarella glacialis]